MTQTQLFDLLSGHLLGLIKTPAAMLIVWYLVDAIKASDIGLFKARYAAQGRKLPQRSGDHGYLRPVYPFVAAAVMYLVFWIGVRMGAIAPALWQWQALIHAGLLHIVYKVLKHIGDMRRKNTAGGAT